jgi:hypothetical protein
VVIMNGASMTSPPTGAEAAGLPAAWLCDNCPCTLCRDPVSGQRLLHVTDIPADVAVAGSRVSADSVERDVTPTLMASSPRWPLPDGGTQPERTREDRK